MSILEAGGFVLIGALGCAGCMLEWLHRCKHPKRPGGMFENDPRP